LKNELLCSAGTFLQCCVCSILGFRRLVLENGAFQPPKGFVFIRFLS
jgi:hypothetical protein